MPCLDGLLQRGAGLAAPGNGIILRNPRTPAPTSMYVAHNYIRRCICIITTQQLRLLLLTGCISRFQVRMKEVTTLTQVLSLQADVRVCSPIQPYSTIQLPHAHTHTHTHTTSPYIQYTEYMHVHKVEELYARIHTRMNGSVPIQGCAILYMYRQTYRMLYYGEDGIELTNTSPSTQMCANAHNALLNRWWSIGKLLWITG